MTFEWLGTAIGAAIAIVLPLFIVVNVSSGTVHIIIIVVVVIVVFRSVVIIAISP